MTIVEMNIDTTETTTTEAAAAETTRKAPGQYVIDPGTGKSDSDDADFPKTDNNTVYILFMPLLLHRC